MADLAHPRERHWQCKPKAIFSQPAYSPGDIPADSDRLFRILVNQKVTFTETRTGVAAYYRNFTSFHAEGIYFTLNATTDISRWGELAFALTEHKYLTNEFQATAASAIVDCEGVYGTSRDPVPEFRSTFRINWFYDDYNASLLWRHIGAVDAQSNEAGSLYSAFRAVSANNYADL